MGRKKLKGQEVLEDTMDFSTEVFEVSEVVPEVKVEAVEVQKEPSLALATQLEGHPKVFAEQDLEGLLVLQSKGIAADFGEDGWARGHLWRAFVRKG